MAAKFVRDQLFKNLFGHQHFSGNLARALEDAYQVRLAARQGGLDFQVRLAASQGHACA